MPNAFVKIKAGTYRGIKIKNKNFPVLKDFALSAKGGGNITVDGSGHPGFPEGKFRVRVEGVKNFYYTDDAGKKIASGSNKAVESKKETDEEIVARMDRRFSLMRKMTRGAMDGCIKSLIITGPAGIGKTYGVIDELRQSSLFDVIAHGEAALENDGTTHHASKKRYDIVKGVTTVLGLYVKLWDYSDEGNVVVFDDCDDVLEDPDCLNMLKAALDSGDKRILHYNKQSKLLVAKGIENQFDFKGSVIFITNLDMRETVSKSTGSAKKKAHVKALMSRGHYLDLTISTEHEKMLRIDSVYATGALFKDHKVSNEKGAEIIAFMHENKKRLNELSLRMAINLADLMAMGPEDDNEWKLDAELLCMS